MAACVYFAAVTFLLRPCLTTIVGYTHTHTHRLMREIMKYDVEMGSGAMICIPSFIRTSSGIQKLMGGGGGEFTETDLLLG
jgi:hypothetical protein